jgi:hypothetical protein
MTLPNYKDSLEYWTEMDKRYSCKLIYGFILDDNQIKATCTDTKTVIPFCKLSEIPYYSSKTYVYMFPTIPNQADFSLYLKDFLYKLKLDRINNDFS